MKNIDLSLSTGKISSLTIPVLINIFRGTFMDKIISFLVEIVGTLFKNLSPEITALIQGFVRNLYTQAKATENPFDDLAVKILAAVFNVSLE